MALGSWCLLQGTTELLGRREEVWVWPAFLLPELSVSVPVCVCVCVRACTHAWHWVCGFTQGQLLHICHLDCYASSYIVKG